ncbi:hypothetical protein I546_1878 [Mycobacterium kansasii 732]|nr:hypothetical protein I546_1878 [Mycobacterium kansasii 732]
MLLLVQHGGPVLGGGRCSIEQLGFLFGGDGVAGQRGLHRLIALTLPVQRVGLALDRAHHRAAAPRQLAPVRGILGQMRHGVAAQRRLGGGSRVTGCSGDRGDHVFQHVRGI